jgi:hypothetical protein
MMRLDISAFILGVLSVTCTLPGADRCLPSTLLSWTDDQVIELKGMASSRLAYIGIGENYPNRVLIGDSSST